LRWVFLPDAIALLANDPELSLELGDFEALRRLGTVLS
jgi:hypothetical protein